MEAKEKEEFDVFGRLLKSRTLFLMGEIEPEIVSDIIAKLIYLDNLSHDKEIKLYINSPGGHIDGFFAIYDIIQQISAPVKTICAGEACSAAAALLAGGSTGKRLATPNSLIMIHNLQISDLSGSMTELTIQMKMLDRLNSIFTGILSKHSGQTLAKVKKDCQQDYYLSAEEALEYGIIDKVLTPRKKIATKKVSKKKT